MEEKSTFSGWLELSSRRGKIPFPVLFFLALSLLSSFLSLVSLSLKFLSYDTQLNTLYHWFCKECKLQSFSSFIIFLFCSLFISLHLFPPFLPREKREGERKKILERRIIIIPSRTIYMNKCIRKMISCLLTRYFILLIRRRRRRIRRREKITQKIRRESIKEN